MLSAVGALPSLPVSGSSHYGTDALALLSCPLTYLPLPALHFIIYTPLFLFFLSIYQSV